jgi:uncharacterized protein (UPF0179 family)
MTLQNGKTYLVKSDRKGTFMGKCTGFDSTWAEFEITAGKAKAMLEYNEKEKGEKVTVRQSFCIFTEQPESATA